MHWENIKKTTTLEGYKVESLPFDELMEANRPVVLKGAAADWALVKEGLNSHQAAMQYLNNFYNGMPVGTLVAAPGVNGRFFYNEAVTGLNFEARRLKMDDVLTEIEKGFGEDSPTSFYIGSTTIDACLPGFRAQNDVLFDHPMFENNAPLASIWIGNPSTAACHYDAPNNIACCVVGKRRFTLFPPDQIHNLYPGPIDLTPGGQAITMVDFNNPDFEKYPRFKQAMESAEVADLEPGDVLFYPSLWWHQVNATDKFNVLVNYWWNTSPKFMGTPMNVLKHALLSLRDRPQHEKKAWKEVFDYYIFGDAQRPVEHLPEGARGTLDPIDDFKARQLRTALINALNR